MNDDPFGGGQPDPVPAYSPRPLTVIAFPGQEVRIAVAGGPGRPAGYTDPDNSAASPSGSPDNSAASPSGSPDNSAASPPGSKDAFDGGGPPASPPPAYSPRPMLIVAQPGQEVRILAAGDSATLPAFGMDPDNSAASPSGSPNARWPRPR
jgi:hypothetical protein